MSFTARWLTTVALLTLAIAAPARAAVPNPIVSAPVTGGLHGIAWMAAPFDVGAYGYTEREYFVSGSARAYGSDDPPADYVTRILVYRPADGRRFSGNVDVEWNNVTLQADLPVDFMWLYPQVLRRGDAYVQVTAQRAGMCAILATGACTPTSVKGYDAERYAPLHHPGDQYAFDIFSQAAQAVVRPRDVAPLGRLRPRHVFAIGESQSASELDHYMRNGADRAARLFDGFLVDADAHSQRADTFRVPTMHLWGEESAQPVRLTTKHNDVIWSVAGAAHSDHWVVQGLAARMAHNFLGTPLLTRPQERAGRLTNGAYGQEGPGASTTCAGNTEFPRRYATDAMLSDLQRWVRTGSPPPSAPPLQFSGAGEVLQQAPPAGALPGLPTDGVNLAALGLSPLALDHDAHGNAIGGLRLPVITVPVAGYGGAACVLLGTTTPLAPAELREQYPTHAEYVAEMLAATRRSVRRHYMTTADGYDLQRRTCASAIPEWGETPAAAQPATCRHIRRLLRYRP